MAIDELGLDPYQRAAITFVRRSMVVATVLVVTGGACWKYGSDLGEVGQHLVAGGACATVGGVLLFCVAKHRLGQEGLAVRDAC